MGVCPSATNNSFAEAKEASSTMMMPVRIRALARSEFFKISPTGLTTPGVVAGTGITTPWGSILLNSRCAERGNRETDKDISPYARVGWMADVSTGGHQPCEIQRSILKK